MPAAPRPCPHRYVGQDGGRDLYRGLQHHPAGPERGHEREFMAGHGHAQIGQLCADLWRTCHGAAAAHSGGYLIASIPPRPITVRNRRWGKGRFPADSGWSADAPIRRAAARRTPRSGIPPVTVVVSSKNVPKGALGTRPGRLGGCSVVVVAVNAEQAEDWNRASGREFIKQRERHERGAEHGSRTEGTRSAASCFANNSAACSYAAGPRRARSCACCAPEPGNCG